LRPYRRPALIERRMPAVLAAVPRVDRAPASAGPRRLAPLRARPTLGVSVGEQQSHYCDTEQNKTDRAHAVLPVHLIPSANSLRMPASRPRASGAQLLGITLSPILDLNPLEWARTKVKLAPGFLVRSAPKPRRVIDCVGA